MRIRCVRLSLALVAALLVLFFTAGCGNSLPPEPAATYVSSTRNPLVAKYYVRTFRAGTVWVEFGTDTSYGRQTSLLSTTTTASFYDNAVCLVAGMKPQTTYHMRAHAEFADGTDWVDQDHTFTTGALPDIVLPEVTVTRPSADLEPGAGVEAIDLVAPANTHTLGAFVTDLDGNIIWYYDAGAGNSSVPFKFLPDGNVGLLVGNSLQTDLREIDLAGNIIRDLSNTELTQRLAQKGYSISVSTFHHDFLVLPDGHWIVLINTTVPYADLPGYPGTTNVLGDVVIDLDPDWNPVWVWSSFDHLDVNRHPYQFPDWIHSNALVYLPDGNLLLSMRHQSWLLKLDYADGTGAGDILWRLGFQGDFSLVQNDPTQWFFAQHAPSLVSATGSQLTLAVFDNGNTRVVSTGGICSGPTSPVACYSRATIFQIDQNAKTANLIWQYSPGLYSYWGGAIFQLGNQNVEFDMTAPFDTPSSRVLEIAPGSGQEVVDQIDITGGNAYRAYRIPSLYPGITW